ncbi:MAG: DUF3857 domain-containing protein [Planctomycetes bacterium]|nr:DUF3857 domain-containing protein [Planctomycetota bacterium]
MKLHNRAWVLFLLAALSCRSSESGAESASTEVSAELATPAPPRAPIPQLARRAFDLTSRGRPLESIELLLEELPERLRSAPWADALLVADSVVAAYLLEHELDKTNAWRLAAERLEAAKPFPANTPPELAAALDVTLARGLTRTGRVEEARRLMRANGALVDWRFIGPFPNERGAGFDLPQPPENALDFDAVQRGKEREVRWRANPAPEQPMPFVFLQEMLRPNTQAVAYLATAVRVEQPREVVLALGSSGALKVWHGATLAHSSKVQRLPEADQTRVVLALREGWNPILIKSCVEEGTGWSLTARLTELDGRPLSGWSQDASQAPAAPREFVAAQTTELPHARATLERTLADASASAQHAEAHRLLAVLHMCRSLDDIAAHSAKKHAEAALALEPDDVQTLYLVARANEPGAGESIEEIRHNERLTPLKRVLERDPQHVGALLDLADFYDETNPIPERVDEYTRRAHTAAPDNTRALRARAGVLGEGGRSVEAWRLVEHIWTTREGQLRDDEVAAAAERALERGDDARELALLERGIKSGVHEVRVREALFARCRREGDLATYQRLLTAWLERAPCDVNAMLNAAGTLEVGGELSAARELLDRAYTICPEDARIAFQYSRIAQRENDLAAADRWLAEVIRLDPGYDKARRQRQVLLESTQDPFDAPYRWDALERRSAALPPSDASEPLHVVDRTTVWRVNADGSEHMYEHVLLRVNSSGGVKSLDKYWIQRPGGTTLQVYNVRVVRPDGTFERAPAPRGGNSGGGRFYDLPTLQVGDLVDVEYRLDERGPDVFGQYFGVRHNFYEASVGGLAPVQRAELVVLAPQQLPIYAKAHNGEALEHSVTPLPDGGSVHRWVARDLERPTPQSAMPDAIEFAPTVDVSTYPSWEAFASWWWSFIEKEFVTTPAMKEKVAELTAGLSDEMDKVRAIARFVGQEIRYNAWSFGTHGYEPFSAATIFERRFGDCKDKSILLRQLLAEIGVKAHPVLINAEYRRPEEKLDIAMVGHFNHCIAYVPATDKRPGFYLDATADRNPIEYLRADDQGAKVLHVDADASSIERIDYTPALDNALVRSYDVTLDSAGGAEVRLRDESIGDPGVQLRYRFGGEKGDLAKRVADALGQAFGKVDVLDARTSTLEDIGAPAQLDARFKATDVWTRDAAGAHLRLSFDNIGLLEAAREPAGEREWEMVFDRPFELRTRVTYRLPEGVELGALPANERIEADGLVTYSLTTRRTDQGVEVERTFTLHERRIPKARYADFQDALREIQNAETRTIVLRTAAIEASVKENK